MSNAFKTIFLFVVLFSCFNLYAQALDTPVCVLEFKEINANLDSFVSSDEMQAYQAKKFEVLDQDKSGDIDIAELKNDQTEMYSVADKDLDGKITKDESSRQFNEYFKQMDKNGDGRITEAEYTDYWKLIYKF